MDGGGLRGRGPPLSLPLKHLRNPEASNRLKTDSVRLSVERVPGGSFVQDDESLHVEKVPADTGLNGKSRFKRYLSPRANPGQPPQVPGIVIVMLGKASLFSTPTIRVGIGPFAFLSSDGANHKPLPERRDQHTGVLWNQDADELVDQVWKTVTFLEGLGLTVNREKSSPSPNSSHTWVGIVWNAQLDTWARQQRLLDRIQDVAFLLSRQK